MRIFDAHTHVDTRGFTDLQTLALFGVEGLVTCAHDVMPFSCQDTLFDHFARLLDFDCKRLRANAITPYVALGIHPRGVPKRGVNEVLDRLPEFLALDPVVAVGEIGLQSGGDEERSIFRAQLEIAKNMGLPCIVHTPESDKDTVTEKILTIIDQVGIDKSAVLIDHVNEKNFPIVRDSGCWIGFTVQVGKLTEARAADLIESSDRNHCVLDSDLASASLELLALPKAVLELRKRGFPREDIEKVAFENACRFYSVSF